MLLHRGLSVVFRSRLVELSYNVITQRFVCCIQEQFSRVKLQCYYIEVCLMELGAGQQSQTTMLLHRGLSVVFRSRLVELNYNVITQRFVCCIQEQVSRVKLQCYYIEVCLLYLGAGQQSQTIMLLHRGLSVVFRSRLVELIYNVITQRFV